MLVISFILGQEFTKQTTEKTPLKSTILHYYANDYMWQLNPLQPIIEIIFFEQSNSHILYC